MMELIASYTVTSATSRQPGLCSQLLPFLHFHRQCSHSHRPLMPLQPALPVLPVMMVLPARPVMPPLFFWRLAGQ